MKKITLTLALSCLSICTLFAQDDPEKKLGVWYSVFSNHRLSENWNIWNETNLNLYESTSDLDQFWCLTGLQHFLKNGMTASLGYGFFYTDPNYDQGTNDELFAENRIFEQFAFNRSYGKVKVQHRYRLEHRIFDRDVNKVVVHRFRYRLALSYPFSEKWFVQVFDEVFLNINKNTFNQNRLVGNVGYKIATNFDIRVGYMKLHTPNRKFDRALLTINFKTDWRSDESN